MKRYRSKSTFDSKHLKEKLENTMIKKYGYQLIALVPTFISSSMDKKLMKSCGKTWDQYRNELPENHNYRRIVDKVTKSQNVNILENHDKKGEYHLDHKFSVAEGFRLGISPFVIGDIVNLEYIPALDNMKKGAKCSIEKDELIERYNKTKENKNEQK